MMAQLFNKISGLGIISLSLFLFHIPQATANMGIPTMVIISPWMVLNLIPVIIIEFLILRRFIKKPAKVIGKGVTFANLLSTLLGVPALWLSLYWMIGIFAWFDPPVGNILNQLGELVGPLLILLDSTSSLDLLTIFAFAFIGSVFFEYLFLRWYFALKGRKLLVPLLWAHLGSYAFMVFIAFLFLL